MHFSWRAERKSYPIRVASAAENCYLAATMDPRSLLIESFHAAVGAGKAAAAMALAVEQHWPSAAPLDGLVITRYRHGLLTNRIKVIEAGHPVPDASGEKAAQEILRRAKAFGPNDLLLALVSGGASSLMSLPAEGIGMEQLKATTRELLRCGAPIQDMNTVRK